MLAAVMIAASAVLVTVSRPGRGGKTDEPARPAARPSRAWTFQTGGPIKGAAAIGDGAVFVGSGDGRVYGLDLRTGRQKWVWPAPPDSQPTSPPASGAIAAIEPIEGSALWHDGAVYIGSTDGVLYAIDAASGRLRWRYATDHKIVGGASVIRAPGSGRTWIVVGSHDSYLHCVDAATGERVWRYETDNYINGTPAVADGKVVAGGCDAKIHVVSAADGSLLQRIDTGSYIAASVTVKGARAYVGNYGNEVVCANLNTGRIAWRYEDREKAYYSTPAVTGQLVLIGGRDKRLHAIDRQKGKQRWTFPTRGAVDSSPVVWRDKVIVGSEDGRLYMVNLRDGSEFWSYDIGEAITAPPAVGQGMIVVGAGDGVVYAFDMTGKPRPRPQEGEAEG